jgi:predicted urease superfamily metal-dependent hydrolase
METTTDKALYLFCKLFDDGWDYSHEEWDFERTVKNAALYYGEDPYQDKIGEIGKPDFETLNFFHFFDECARLLDAFDDLSADQKCSMLYRFTTIKTLWISKVKNIAVWPDMKKEAYEEKLSEGVALVQKAIEEMLREMAYFLGMKPTEDAIDFMERYLAD